MARRQLLRSVLAVGVGVGLGLGLVGFQAGAAQADERGSVAIMFSESVVPQLFKAGVFMYGAESVEVSMGNSGALSARLPADRRFDLASDDLDLGGWRSRGHLLL
jgi:hypothetical protein